MQNKYRSVCVCHFLEAFILSQMLSLLTWHTHSADCFALCDDIVSFAKIFVNTLFPHVNTYPRFIVCCNFTLETLLQISQVYTLDSS